MRGGGDGPEASAKRADFVGEASRLRGCEASECDDGGVTSRWRFSNLAGSSNALCPDGDAGVARVNGGASVATLPASDAMNVEL